jgi:alpha-glucosidase (family GH31 glycosyl hydrolase)
MILMNMYGIPNTGAPLCSTNETNPLLERLCVHYFALSVISPLAFYSDINNKSLDGHPFKFKTGWENMVTEFSNYRTMFLMYQREQLKKIETSGGALIRPLFTEFGSINTENDSSIDMGSVMFGDSILASYQLYDIDTNRTITLPKEANWF